MGDTLISMFRSLCGIIDSVIYILISKLYELLIETSNMILYSQNAMDAIGKRIGLILGIVMLFRLAISLISYIISPDKLSDSAKGGGKLIKNTIFALILLITINIIFSQAYKLQIKVVESKFIEKIFFGTQAELPNVDLAYSLYSSFLTPSIEACEDMFDPNVGITSDCETEISALKNNVTISALQYVMDNHELNYILINYSALNTKVNGDYLFNYFMIVSTVAGGIVALLLITFTMDLAVRAVKLLFLQIIAPFPIIASIDPGKGSDVFKKWSKECINTYISLFIRLIAINFAVFMMTLIRTEFHDVFILKGPLMTVLIIIGCLMFAKQAPKLIEDMTGLKTDGFALNPIKKFQEQALFGKQITGFAAGTTAGAVAGAIGTATGAGIGQFFLGGLKGAADGTFHGKKFGEVWKNQTAANSRMRTAILNESTLGGRIHQRVSDALGTGGELATLERQKHAIQDQIDRIDRDIKAEEDLKTQIKGRPAYRNRQQAISQNQAVSDISGKLKERGITQVRNGEGTAGLRYQEMLRQVERLKHAPVGQNFTYTDENGVSILTNFHTEADAVEEAERLRQAAEHYADNRGWQEYLTEVSNGGHGDATVTSMQNVFDDAYRVTHRGNTINRAAPNYGTQINGALGEAKGRLSRLQVAGSQDERNIAAHDRNIANLSGQKQPLNDRMRDISSRESVANANKSAVGK
jgi:hypothetical protein